MSKRTIAIVALLAVFALSLLGVQAVGLNALASVSDSHQAMNIDIGEGLMLAGDEPGCPPAIPFPGGCGG